MAIDIDKTGYLRTRNGIIQMIIVVSINRIKARFRLCHAHGTRISTCIFALFTVFGFPGRHYQHLICKFVGTVPHLPVLVDLLHLGSAPLDQCVRRSLRHRRQDHYLHQSGVWLQGHLGLVLSHCLDHVVRPTLLWLQQCKFDLKKDSKLAWTNWVCNMY